MAYAHITYNERRSIERFLDLNKSKRQIAVLLSRSVSSISEEIKQNSVKGRYDARKAEHKAKQRRERAKLQCLVVAMDKDLKEYVIENIRGDQSPQGISERLKYVDTHLSYASTKAVYKFVRSPHGRQIEKHLYSKAVRKKDGPKRGKRSIWDDDRISIERRPTTVEKRLEFGHFEADFVESGKDGTGSLLVLCERKTRYPFIRYLEDRSTKHVNTLIKEMLNGVPAISVTLDNDLSFQKHKKLSELIRADIYFCHSYCSHEKGGVENRNKAVRRYLKKGSDLSSFSEKYIQWVEEKLRNKFMVCLKGKNPKEVWDEEMAKHRAKVLKARETKKPASMRNIIKRESVRLQG